MALINITLGCLSDIMSDQLMCWEIGDKSWSWINECKKRALAHFPESSQLQETGGTKGLDRFYGL